MKLFSSELQQEIWYTIRSNKRRTVFTALGVFAGMFFFTLLTGLGTGIGNAIANNLNGVSSRALFVFTGRTTLPYQGFKANRDIPITYRDYEEIRHSSKNFESVSCMAQWLTGDQMNATRVIANGRSSTEMVFGITDTYEQLNTTAIAYGRGLRTSEINNSEPVCVIGKKLVKNFYPEATDALGQYMEIGGVAFRIIGIITPSSDGIKVGMNPDWAIEVPISFAINNDPTREVILSVMPYLDTTVEQSKDEVFKILSKNHNIDPRDKDVIQTIGMEVFIEIFGMIQAILNVLIWVIGLGTLFTGVISVSNILLVTVRERQREIGVRRALGARPTDIRAQFMLEALFIILLAGISGLFVGLLMTLMVGSIADHTEISGFLLRPYPEPWVLVFSVIIMVIAGVLAGLLPVYKALQIKAIDAIRDE